MGWGVQTFTIAAMMAHDDLPRCEAVIFADPQAESRRTYAFRAAWEGYLTDRGLNVITVSKGNLKDDFLNPAERAVTIPAFTSNGEYAISGVKDTGRVLRQCTAEYKTQPVRAAIRAILGVGPGGQVKEKVGVILGISADEAAARMRTSDVGWIEFLYPLYDLKMDRGHCEEYLKSKGLPVPPKSSCIFCPNHTNLVWLDMKRNDPEDWADAVAFDKMARHVRPNLTSELYLHRSGKPLDEVNLNEGQLELLPCLSGFCGT